MFNWLSSLFSSPAPEAMASAKQAVERLIKDYPVAVFSKSYCQAYCSKAKSTLKASFDGAQIGILELDQMDEGDAIQNAVANLQKTSRVTVPQIYIKGNLIGGNSELQSLISRSKEWQTVKDSVKKDTAENEETAN